MITFLRKIRKSFIVSGSIRKYVLYAIGEIALVVIGILIALQINTWNEAYKLNMERNALIASMSEDWRDTSVRLEDTEQKYDSLTINMERFMIMAYLDSEDINLDTLVHLAGSFFRYYNFEPNLTTYEEAKASGRLRLIKDNEVPYLYTEFFEHLEDFNNHVRLCSEIYYHGSIWEMRKRSGFISQYDDIGFYSLLTNKEITLNSYLSLIKEPAISAAFEAQWNVISNLDRITSRLRVSTDNMINKLDKME